MKLRSDRLAAVLCLILSSCGDAAPPQTTIQTAAAHLRYYAQFWQSDLGSIRASIEAHRADVYAYLGLQDDDVVDYHLLDTHDKVASHCQDEPNCTVDRQVFTLFEVDHHNLIHAFLAKAGHPPRLIREGTAEAIDCYPELAHAPYELGLAGWRDLFQVSNAISPGFYVSSMRLVRFLLLRFGPQRFMAYYGSALDTREADEFAATFQDAWAMSIDDAWSAANAGGDVLPLPICPCRAPAMVPDAAPQWVFGTMYAPLAAPPNSRLTLRLPYSAPDEHTLLDCARAQTPALLAADYQEGVNIIQLDDQPHYLLSQSSNGGNPTLTTGAMLSPDCMAAGTVALDYDTQRIGIIVPRGSAPAYVKITVPETEVITSTVNPGGGFRICSDCSLSDCAPVPPTPNDETFPPSAGVPVRTTGVMVEVDPSSLVGTGLASFIGKLVFQ